MIHIGSLSNKIGKVSEVLTGCTTSQHLFGLFSATNLERECGIVVEVKLVSTTSSIYLLEQITPVSLGVGSHLRGESIHSVVVRSPALLSLPVRNCGRCAVDCVKL
jgi:Na+-transporting methylmalonyl-CoA/oxaloacetate decarboxylase beta subunit